MPSYQSLNVFVDVTRFVTSGKKKDDTRKKSNNGNNKRFLLSIINRFRNRKTNLSRLTFLEWQRHEEEKDLDDSV